MQQPIKLNFLTLLLMISFASVNAVLYTPALPDIAQFFAISTGTAQLTMTWFLIGYAVGQLLYGPVANRFGRKPALYAGILLQIISSLLCVLAGFLHEYILLVLTRFTLALGAGVGLKMTFTLINECYEPKIASQKIAYLMLAFGITPGLGIALGGILDSNYGWLSCFYASAIYGIILLILTMRLPETKTTLDLNALQLNSLAHGYSSQFKNPPLVASGLLMGINTCFIYVFAALGPFVTINIFGMDSTEYGLANILPPIGLIIGSLYSAYLAKEKPLEFIIKIGIAIASSGTLLMLVGVAITMPVLFAIFFPMIIIYFGLALIMPNAAAIAMKHTKDKAHGSAVMSFINMGLATVVVLSLGVFSVNTLLLPIIYLIACIVMVGLYKWLAKQNHDPHI